MPRTRPNVFKSGKLKDISPYRIFIFLLDLPSGITTSECRKSSSKILNCQRSMLTVVHKINSPNRLVGGADKDSIVEETPLTVSPESIQEVPNPNAKSSLSSPIPSTLPSSSVEKFLEESMQLEENSLNKQFLPASGPCCFCNLQTSESVG